MAVGQDFLNALKHRNLMNADGMGERFLASLGTHLANLRHRGMPMRYANGVPFIDPNAFLPPLTNDIEGGDLRSHLLIIGPPSTGKSYWGRIFFDARIGLANQVVPWYSCGRVTEAGLTGQKMWDEKGRGHYWKRGLFWEQRHSVLFFSEYTNLTNAAKSQHSQNLSSTMLDALDSGEVTTNIGNVSDSYVTYSTIIGGVQPQRFDTTSGFHRRFLYWNNPVPNSPEELRDYKRTLFKHKSTPLDKEELGSIREAFREQAKRIANLDSVKLSQEVRDEITMRPKITLDMINLVERASIGHSLMMSPLDSSSHLVTLTDSLKEFIKSLIIHKGQALANPEVYELLLRNTLEMSRVLPIVAKEQHCSRRQAELLIKSCLEFYDSDGLRAYIAIPKGNQNARVKIPTGMSVAELENMGYDVRSYETSSGLRFAVKKQEEHRIDEQDEDGDDGNA